MDNIFNKITFKYLNNLIDELLNRNAKELLDTPAIISENLTISHLQVKEQVLYFVSLLEKESLPKNICVGLRFQNMVNFYIAHLTLLKMGIAQAIINPYDMGYLQLKNANEMDVDLIIQDIQISNALPITTLQIDSNFKIQKKKIKELRDNPNLPIDTTTVILSSGTTGKKKVLYFNSEKQLLRYSTTIDKFHGKSLERFYCFTTIYYPHARFSNLLALLKGMTIILPQNRSKDLISFCNDYRVDHLQLTGDQALNILLKQKSNLKDNTTKIQLPNLKSCVLSNSLITEPIRKKILSTITSELYIVYGTNEFGLISEATPFDIKTHCGTVGKPFSSVSLKILQDNGIECKVGEVGNIVVKSNSMISKYDKDKSSTKMLFDEAGFWTNDLGRLTENGNLIFEGRKDDMMIFTGENIYPREIESVLEAHSNVIESAVFPLTIGLQSGIPFAVVTVNKTTNENDLLQWCNNKLGWRRPQRIFIAKELPKNSMGKVLKKELIKIISKKLSNYQR